MTYKKHELEHLRPYVAHYSDFQESYKEWVMSDTIEEFETRWEVIRDKYKLESNCWIADMYNQRVHWAKAFLKDIFLAGMSTSGRSESINSFFDDFVNSSTMLNDFLVQYDKAVASRRAAEEDEDFKTMNSRSVLSSIHPIEAKAGECYTRKVFEIFKKEWMEATSNLTHETISKSTEEIKYRVGQLDIDKKYWRIVTFYLSNKIHVTCSCAKYDACGILCKHILYVMKKRHVNPLPSHYILPRWTLNARYKVGKRSIGLEEMNNGNGVSAYTLCSYKIKQYGKKPLPVENVSQGSCVRISQVDMMPQLFFWDPHAPTNTKGRPKIASRIKSSLEVPKNEHALIVKD
ncbi:unnamed protein product [Lactuca saligna]|uniref:SWIM-type domain-containing protein n=1 Tax=Lactuca saligna TaxID=75948 RepID=A0AA36EH59_LACSI|nr:unnamed protein product [Lactuca saligna]